MALERNKDFMDICNPGRKYSVEEFEKEICRQCSRPECFRSSYKQDATDKRLERAKQLTKFVDPTTVPVSDLSHWPDEDGIHRAEVQGIVDDSGSVDQAAQALSALQGEAGASPVIEVEKVSEQPERPADPWEVPKNYRRNIYKEYDDPKQDPWSAEYEGGRNLTVEPGATITLSGRKK